MFERKSNSGHAVIWNPDNEELGKQATEEIVGNHDVEVTNAEASEIRAEYQKLLNDKKSEDEGDEEGDE